MPIGGATIGAIAAALGALAVLAYVLKMRRRRFEVPFSALWQRVLRERETTSLWRKLRRLLSLLLQLAVLALLVGAAMDPQLDAAPEGARAVVIIVDASASMKATDAGPGGKAPRIEEARDRAHALIDSLGGGDSAMVVRMDGRTTPLTRFESDKARLREAVDGIEASDTPAELRRALVAAADALHGRQRPMIVIIGDGAYGEAALAAATWEPLPATADFADKRLATVDLSDIDVRFVPIGTAGTNLGIVAFNVRRYITNRLSYEVLIEVQNFGDEPAAAKLTLYNGGLAIDVHELSLAPGERARRLFRDLAGGDGHRLRAELARTDGADLFALDDRAFALLPERKRQEVLLVTADHLFLEAFALVYDNIRVDKLSPAEFDTAVAAGTLPAYDVIVLEDHTPPAVPATGHLLYFNPRGEHSPFRVVDTLRDPTITQVHDDHPVMRWVVFTDVRFDDVGVFAIDPARGDVALATSIRSPVMAARREPARKIVACGFSLRGSDIMVRVAFPLIMVNVLDWFAGDDSDLLTTYVTGRRFRIPLDAAGEVTEVDVHEPTRQVTKAPVTDGVATFFGSSVGIYRVVARGAGEPRELELAANLANPEESHIAPHATLVLGGRELPPPDRFEASARRSLWPYLALLALALLAIEWVTYNRRITV